MQSNELETIAASIQDALHRAYALGRSDALRRVVEMVQADELGGKTVALLAHDKPPAAEVSQTEMPQIEALHIEASKIEAPVGEPRAVSTAVPGDAAHNDNTEPAGTHGPEQHSSASPPGSIKDFLLDYLYPLGAKK